MNSNHDNHNDLTLPWEYSMWHSLLTYINQNVSLDLITVPNILCECWTLTSICTISAWLPQGCRSNSFGTFVWMQGGFDFVNPRNVSCGDNYHLLAPARDILLLVTRARINTSESHQAVVSKLNCSSVLSSSFWTVSSWAGVSQAMAELVMDRPAANKWSSNSRPSGALCA